MADKGFNSDAFYKAVTKVVNEKGATWKQVSDQTGISPSTLTRLSKGTQPDAPSLAALASWSGVNPGNYVDSVYKAKTTNSLSQISTVLRSDPHLDDKAVDALETILKAAYEGWKKSEQQTEPKG